MRVGGEAWTRFWQADVFLAPPRPGSRQSPDMGDLMATDVLVLLRQTLGRCAEPSPPRWLWTSPCCKGSGQRLPAGRVALSPGLAMRNQQAEHVSCVFLGLCSRLSECFPTGASPLIHMWPSYRSRQLPPSSLFCPSYHMAPGQEVARETEAPGRKGRRA